MLQVQIFIDKDELRGMKPLHEYLLNFLIRHHIIGATVFQGLMGIGEKQHVNRPNTLFSFDEVPLMITFVDEEKKVRHILTELRKEYKGGFIVTNQVEKW